MTNTPTITTTRQALRFMRTEAAGTALKTILSIRTVRQEEHNLITGENTPLELRIEKHANGHITVSPTHNAKFPLHRLGPDRPGRFEILRDHIRDTALHSLMTELQVWLNLTPGPSDPPEEDPQHHLLKLYRSPQVKKTARAEANRIAALHPDLQGPGDPVDQAHVILREFLGPEVVDAVTHLAGDTVTLFHLSIMQSHIKDLQKRAEQFPNDVLLWAHIADTPPHSDVANHVQSATTKATDKLLRHPLNQLRKDWQEILQAFRGLDPDALRQYPDQEPNTLLRLCTHIKTAGTQPSHEATRHLLANPHINSSTIGWLVPKFIDESHRLNQEENEPAQDRLLAQMAVLERYATSHHPRLGQHRWDPTPLRKTLFISGNRTITTWQQLMALTPQWAQHLTSQEELHQYEDRLPNCKTHYRGPRDMNEVMESHPGRDFISLKASRTATFHTVPGKRAAVFTLLADRPFMLAQQHPDGRITLTGHEGELPNLPIPNPHQEDHHGELYAYEDFKRLMQNTAIITMGNTALEKWNQIRKNPVHQPLYGIRLENTSSRAISGLRAQDKDLPTVTNISTALAQAILKMSDIPTWEAAAQAAGTDSTQSHAVNSFQYNAAATLKDHLSQLLSTNPGATSLGLAYLRSNEPIEHPGQFISLTRSLMESSGLEKRAWKTAATLDHATATAITKCCYSPQQAAVALNLIAQAQAAPSPNVARTLASAMAQNLNRPGLPTQNLNIMARLLCQESRRRLDQDPADPEQRDLQHQAQDALDYVLQLTQNEQAISSTTWNSLFRRSNDWHTQMRRGRSQFLTLRQLQKKREESGTPPESWESLIPQTTTGGYTIVPLTDENQLIQESLDMDHCVYRYTARCRAGMRIFSIQREGKKIATSAIALEHDEWRIIQTRGAENSFAIPEQVKTAMEEIAARYTEASRTGRE